VTTFEQEYEQLTDEALLEILAEGPEHYRAEALAAAEKEARGRGLDPSQAAHLEPSVRRPSKLRRFLGFYFTCGGYGALAGFPLAVSSSLQSDAPVVSVGFDLLALMVFGASFLYLGSRLGTEWRLYVFWAAVLTSISWVAVAIWPPSGSLDEPSGVALAISLATNLYVLVRLRRHARRTPSSSA